MVPSHIHERSAPVRIRHGTGASFGLPDCASLEANSHRPEVQRLIRAWIRRGTIRVVPMPGSPIRVRVLLVASGASRRG